MNFNLIPVMCAEDLERFVLSRAKEKLPRDMDIREILFGDDYMNDVCCYFCYDASEDEEDDEEDNSCYRNIIRRILRKEIPDYTYILVDVSW
jgi:hypothetical protein